MLVTKTGLGARLWGSWKAKLLCCLVLGVIGVVLFSTCGSSSEGDDPAVSASELEMEQEFRDLVRGTIEAAEIDPASLRFGDYSDFSFGEFAAIHPAGYCGRSEGDVRGQYQVLLDTKNIDGIELYSVEQYEAKVAAVRNYWRALGMDPKNTPSGDNASRISARTPLGGKVSYMASLYGDVMSVESACSEKINYHKNRR